MKLRFRAAMAKVAALVVFLPIANANAETVAVIGDAGVANERTAAIRDSILDSRIDQVVMAGDNLYRMDGTYASVWDRWREKGLSFPIVALGNHTLGYAKELEYFGFEREYYSRRISGARFIVLNSDHVRTVGEQMRFLDRELAIAQERSIFLVFHHPPFTLTRRHGWKEREKFQIELRKRLHRHHSRITALIVGHDHIASLLEVGEIPMIVSGATFETLEASPVDYVEDALRVRTGWLFRGGAHWARLDFGSRSEPDSPVWLNFVRPDRDSVECSVRIAPRPALYRDNCSKSNNKSAVVRHPPEVEAGHDEED